MGGGGIFDSHCSWCSRKISDRVIWQRVEFWLTWTLIVDSDGSNPRTKLQRLMNTLHWFPDLSSFSPRRLHPLSSNIFINHFFFTTIWQNIFTFIDKSHCCNNTFTDLSICLMLAIALKQQTSCYHMYRTSSSLFYLVYFSRSYIKN